MSHRVLVSWVQMIWGVVGSFASPTLSTNDVTHTVNNYKDIGYDIMGMTYISHVILKNVACTKKQIEEDYYLINGKDLKISIQYQLSLTSSYMMEVSFISYCGNCLIFRILINGTCDIIWYDVKSPPPPPLSASIIGTIL